MGNEWKKIGSIVVDAGLCWIGDPCYILHKNPKAEKYYDRPPQAIGDSWPDFCDKLQDMEDGSMQLSFDLGHDGLGVVTSTGHGDGCYPVFAKHNENGCVAEVKVVFIAN